MIDIKDIDLPTKMVAFNTDQGSMTIINGQVRASIGFYTPVEARQAMRQYNSIMTDAEKKSLHASVEADILKSFYDALSYDEFRDGMSN